MDILGHSQLTILLYVALAMLLGAMIGLEREFANKPAGLRTHMLVAGASALLVLLSELMVAKFGTELNNQRVQADPIRVVQSVITGVSFLGAGTIIRSRSDAHVEGLTTAASILFASALGICVAVSQLLLAVGLVVLGLITLRGVDFVEGWMERRRERHTKG